MNEFTVNPRKTLVAPSILSADFTRLAEEIAAVEQAGADMLHIDIMDGHFVPNITFGPGMVSALRKVTKLPLDVHLMITAPESFIPRFIDAGADILTIHFESSVHLHRNVQTIKNLKVKAGVSLNPHTPIVLATEIIPSLDLLLLMSVNPGFGGQRFIDQTLTKIRTARRFIDSGKLDCLIEVDGGITDETGRWCVEAGVDILVAGDFIFHSNDYGRAMDSLGRRS